MQIGLVVFDWGGTTVDFGCHAPVAAFIAALKSREIEISPVQARIPMGLAKWDHIRELLRMPEIDQQWKTRFGREWCDGDVDEIYETFLPFQRNVAEELTALCPGVLECQQYLREHGIAIGSSTGYPRVVGEAVVAKAAKLKFEPDAVEYADQVPSGRPAPWMIFRNMEKTAVYPPAAVVKVGDTVPDIEAGRNAGVWSIGVTSSSSELGLTEDEYGQLSATERESRLAEIRQRLFSAGAHEVIDGLLELPALLDKLGSRPDAEANP